MKGVKMDIPSDEVIQLKSIVGKLSEEEIRLLFTYLISDEKQLVLGMLLSSMHFKDWKKEDSEDELFDYLHNLALMDLSLQSLTEGIEKFIGENLSSMVTSSSPAVSRLQAISVYNSLVNSITGVRKQLNRLKNIIRDHRKPLISKYIP